MLNERKIKILEALIGDYIAYGDPISSRTIAKKHGLGISSATIRNEMSDLEEMGFIIQPHASSGRIPSDKGYRMYVDRLVYRDLTKDETRYLKDVILGNINHMEYLMKETAKAISILTKHTTIVSEVGHKKITVKHIQLMPMDKNTIVVVVITVNKLVKNSMVNVDEPLTDETLNQMSALLNKLLRGKNVEDIISLTIADMPHKNIMEDIISAISKILTLEEEIEIFTSGVNNILDYPEFSDLEKAKGIFKTFEEKEVLITLMDKNGSENLQVIIGAENTLEEMKDCSIIKASYMLGGQPMGAIGIVGPTRMDYYNLTSVLNAVVTNINSVLHTINPGGKNEQK